MSFDSKNLTFVPCEPFESRVYDISQDKFVNARITGYQIAIRAIRNPPDAMFTPINAGSAEPRHAAIIAPKWEEIMDHLNLRCEQVSASPQEG